MGQAVNSQVRGGARDVGSRPSRCVPGVRWPIRAMHGQSDPVMTWRCGLAGQGSFWRLDHPPVSLCRWSRAVFSCSKRAEGSPAQGWSGRGHPGTDGLALGQAITTAGWAERTFEHGRYPDTRVGHCCGQSWPSLQLGQPGMAGAVTDLACGPQSHPHSTPVTQLLSCRAPDPPRAKRSGALRQARGPSGPGLEPSARELVQLRQVAPRVTQGPVPSLGLALSF